MLISASLHFNFFTPSLHNAYLEYFLLFVCYTVNNEGAGKEPARQLLHSSERKMLSGK